MPTCNRRAFVSNAIAFFLQQDYSNKELVIVDDGSDAIEDLVPVNEQIRYIRIKKSMTLGEKRNFCVRESRGDLIMHWDDDDWMAPYRISYQVTELLKARAEVCGLQQMYFYEYSTNKCWLYKYPSNAKPWLAGGSLLYTRAFWAKKPFPDIQVASDTEFIFSRTLKAFCVLKDSGFYVASVHPNNTSQKKTANKLWHPVEPDLLKQVTGEKVLQLMQQYRETKIPPEKSTNMKRRVAILITTCNREESLRQMIADLEKENAVYDLKFFIVDDGILKNGKRNYWKTINLLWGKIKNEQFDYYIQLPDDVKLEAHFIQRSIDAWQKITDTKKICLNLFFDNLRKGKTCWTNFWPRLVSYQNKRYLKTQWMDLFYICERNFFTQLQFTVQPIPASRWAYNPEFSSGVGQQLSLRLHTKGFHLYQVTEKLAEHIGDVSIMNPGIRKKEPIESGELPLIYAGMATVPGRENQLKKTISSIEPYMDHLYLYLNGYSKVPDWISGHEKITPFLSSAENSDMGDAGKFFGLNKISDKDYYYFTLDDDMLYPPDYTWKMVEKIELHNRLVIAGCGGYTMKEQVNQFYTDRKASWHISTNNTQDRPVHILHTALTAWHCSAIDFKYEDCEKPNMGDIWLAIAAQKQEVPMILIERPANWAKPLPMPVAETIYGRFRNSCHDQTAVFNSWNNWKVIPFEKAKVQTAASSA